MQTGRSNDGNLTDYWRKLHVLLKVYLRKLDVWIRKMDGLLTETGWAITETGRSIDGKSGLLMEAVQQIFFILGAWKCDFAEFRNPRFRGHLAFFNSFLSILEARKFDFCRVVKPSVQDYQASCEKCRLHFGILKKWFLTIRETNISKYLAMSGNFLNFWGLKMRVAQSWNTRFKGTKFRESEFSVLPNIPHFGSLKIRFLPIRETNVLRYLAKSRNFLNFWGLKMRFALSWNPCCKDTKLRVIKFSAFWQPEYAIFAESWNPRIKGTKLCVSKFCACTNLRVSKFSVFWQSENAIAADSLN